MAAQEPFDFAQTEENLQQTALALQRLENELSDASVEKASWKTPDVIFSARIRHRRTSLDALAQSLQPDLELYKTNATNEGERLASMIPEANAAEKTLYWLRMWRYNSEMRQAMEVDLTQRRSASTTGSGTA